MNRKGAAPVLMYHSVGRIIPDWQWSFLTVPYPVFENHLNWLKKCKYQTVDLNQLYYHVAGKIPLPSRSVVLTFDDGYLDNWTYVAPLLHRYGFKATVFINPEFVDPGDIVRPTLKDVWNGHLREDELEVRGFMSWRELKQISESGVFSVQSHLMSHTWYPVSNEIVDFHHPGDAYYWMDWNEYPADKPFYLLNLENSKVPSGTPVYEHAKSIVATRFFPDEKEARHLTEYVFSNGGAEFFFRRDWKKELQKKVKTFRRNNDINGRTESESERLSRINYELTESKRLIEANLDADVDFLCWPGGGYDDKAVETAQKIYKSVTLGSSDRSNTANCPGDNPVKVKRLGVPYIEHKGNLSYPGGRYLVRLLDEFRGVKLARCRRQVMKLGLLISAACGLWPKRTRT